MPKLKYLVLDMQVLVKSAAQEIDTAVLDIGAKAILKVGYAVCEVNFVDDVRALCCCIGVTHGVTHFQSIVTTPTAGAWHKYSVPRNDVVQGNALVHVTGISCFGLTCGADANYMRV